jgi:anti-sigma factor RsiW
MITSLRRMVTCHWSARRIGRYLDNDPSAPLPPDQKRRLEEHLAVCRRCAGVTAEHRALNRALSRWSQQRLPDAAAMARMHEALERITREGGQ